MLFLHVEDETEVLTCKLSKKKIKVMNLTIARNTKKTYTVGDHWSIS